MLFEHAVWDMDHARWLGGAGAVLVHVRGSYSAEHVSPMHLPTYDYERNVREECVICWLGSCSRGQNVEVY